MRTAFIGFSGPIGYDYQAQGRGPNPVLEDVTGLLLCYDELIFFSRDLCPKDMQKLEYVRFITDSDQYLAKAMVAIEQYAELAADLPTGEFSWEGWHDVVSTVTGNDPAGRVDNHSRPLLDLPDLPVSGIAARLENAILDVGVAASLGVQGIDVLTNSAARRAVDEAIAELDRPNLYTDWHIDIADTLGAIRVTNGWHRGGSYFATLEDLRHHHKVEEFRKFLSELSPDAAEAAERAAEISALADDYARTTLIERHRPRSLYTAIGRAAASPVGMRSTRAPALLHRPASRSSTGLRNVAGERRRRGPPSSSSFSPSARCTSSTGCERRGVDE